MGFKPDGLFCIPVCFFYLRREYVISLLFVSEILAGYFLYFSEFVCRFFFFGVLLYGASPLTVSCGCVLYCRKQYPQFPFPPFPQKE